LDQGRPRSPARLLAPLALVVAAVAVVLVVQASTGSEDSDGDTANRPAEQQPAPKAKRQTQRRASYTVKLNDTLTLISEKTGVSVERLQVLNPDLDPQNLIVGQKIKLRE